MIKEATKTKKTAKKTTQYFEGVGRRKTSVARVRIWPGEKPGFEVNEKKLEIYFPTNELQKRAIKSSVVAVPSEKYSVTVRVSGGGVNSQAEAVAMGLARAITLWQPEQRLILKKGGFLTRDAREKERRKFGLKKARKAPQWSKR